MSQVTIKVAETEHCVLELVSAEGYVILRPVGTIDEDTSLTSYFEVIDLYRSGATPIKSFMFDLGHVTRINSCGIRAWVLFVERLQKLEMAYGILNINELFIEQWNLVSNLLGKKNIPVVAIELPYFCLKCQTREVRAQRVADLKVEANGMPIVPAATCETCNGPLDFDAIIEEYFIFLKRARS